MLKVNSAINMPINSDNRNNDISSNPASPSSDGCSKMDSHILNRLSPTDPEVNENNNNYTKFIINQPMFQLKSSTASAFHHASPIIPLSPPNSNSNSCQSSPQIPQKSPTVVSNNSQQVQQQQQHLSIHHPIPTKVTTSDLVDLERFKLAAAAAAAARSAMSTNGRDLSDYGFRIQLGGLTAAAAALNAQGKTAYVRSETSEELNVDGNEDSDNGENDAPAVSFFFFLSPSAVGTRSYYFRFLVC